MEDFLATFSNACESISRDVFDWAVGRDSTITYDERITKGWPVTDLYTTALILIAYLALIAIGLLLKPANWKTLEANAKNKPKQSPLQAFKSEPIRVLQLIYNVVQVLLCLYMIASTINVHLARAYGWVCVPYDPQDKEMAFCLWVFFCSKVLDFCDTFFIIARGGWRRFSFLHCYHHLSIFAVYWLNVNAGYAGDIYLTIVLNSGIHFLMYTYYALSSIGRTPSWGRYLTQAQMIQFIMMNCQAGYILMNPDDCKYPRNVTLIYLFYIQSLFALFFQFFLGRWGGGGSKKPKRA